MRSLKLLLTLGLTLPFVAWNQNVNMGDYGYDEANPADCSTFGVSGTNFFDDGGAGSNYSANFNDTTVLCPDLNQGTKMTVTFGINAGYTFDVDGSDSIYVYDGPNTSWPLLGVHNSVTDPIGFAYTASWNNPSGCLTIVFISDGAVEGTGWIANAQCGNQFQPFEMHIEAYVNGQGPNALVPADTGFVDICFGDSILFVANPNFPYSAENNNGYGYSQDVNSTITFEWLISDGGTYPDNDSIWFTPPDYSGYIVDLGMTDLFPQVEHMMCKVRVSIPPIFAGTGPVDDTVCLGEITSLIGGVTPTDTVGVEIPPGTFQLGGNYAGLTYLPDGSGAQYQAPIDISGFPVGSTISNSQDLNMVCITMEHSYIGDLEIALQCPTGQQVTLLNSYGPGFIPGGTSGGGIYLGDPIDDGGGGGPGEGWEYCFSSVFNTWGTYPTELGAGNTIPAPNFGNNGPSMNPDGVYLPETDFSAFAGCPVNGQWTIIVQDNLTIDDGYIFEWGLFFDPSFFPGASSYQNYIVSEEWLSDPTIISGQGDTLILVQPNTPGDYNYTYTVTDDFGCTYDTTVTLNVLPLAEIFSDTVACNFGMQVSGTQSYSGGEWISGSGDISFSPNATTTNPNITSTSAGVYTVGFIDAACQDTLYAEITFPQLPTIFADTSVCDLSYQVSGTDVYTTGGVWSEPTGNISFAASANEANPTINATTSGIYTVTYTDNICGNTDDATIEFIGPPSIFGDTIACDFGMFVNGTSSYSGGVWSSPDTAVHFSPNNTVENPQIWTYGQYGLYTVTYTDNACGTSITSQIDFYEYPSTWLSDTIFCDGTIYNLVAPDNNPHATNFEWNTGDLGPEISITEAGTYIVTLSNICHTNTDTINVEYQLCEINTPNVLSLAEGSQNSLWYVEADGLGEFTVYITNRWGNVVYECHDAGAKCYWDGRAQSGNFVNAGTYFYTIEAKNQNGKPIVKHGFIQVVN